jgi:hypothetical protein
MNIGPAKWSTLCAVLLSTGALVSAAPASADPTDDAFDAALIKAGITFPDHSNEIATAHAVCAGLDKSNRSTILAMKLAKDNDLSLKQSGYFIGASVAAYCPQHLGQTDNSTIWLPPYPPLVH